MAVNANLIARHFQYYDLAHSIMARVGPSDWRDTLPDGTYDSNGWRVVDIVRHGRLTDFANRIPECKKLVDFFQTRVEMLVFYSMLPGASIHPHRDMSGTYELGRIRFHVPLVTNPDVDFFVGGRKILMQEGQLWGLNTSYTHAVKNRGTTDRIHLVAEVDVNDWVRSLLPKPDVEYYLHYAHLYFLIVWRGLTKVGDIRALPARLRMAMFVLKRMFWTSR